MKLLFLFVIWIVYLFKGFYGTEQSCVTAAHETGVCKASWQECEDMNGKIRGDCGSNSLCCVPSDCQKFTCQEGMTEAKVNACGLIFTNVGKPKRCVYTVENKLNACRVELELKKELNCGTTGSLGISNGKSKVLDLCEESTFVGKRVIIKFLDGKPIQITYKGSFKLRLELTYLCCKNDGKKPNDKCCKLDSPVTEKPGLGVCPSIPCPINNICTQATPENPTGCLNCHKTRNNKQPLPPGCPCENHDDCPGDYMLCVYTGNPEKRQGKRKCVNCDPRNPNRTIDKEIVKQCNCRNLDHGNYKKNRCPRGYTCLQDKDFYYDKLGRDANNCCPCDKAKSEKWWIKKENDCPCENDAECIENWSRNYDINSPINALWRCEEQGEYNYEDLVKKFNHDVNLCNLRCKKEKGEKYGICIKCPLLYSLGGPDFETNGPLYGSKDCPNECPSEGVDPSSPDYNDYCLPQFACNPVTKACGCVRNRDHVCNSFGNPFLCKEPFDRDESNGPFCECDPVPSNSHSVRFRQCNFKTCYNQSEFITERALKKPRKYGSKSRDIYNEAKYSQAIDAMDPKKGYCAGFTESNPDKQRFP